MTYALAIGQRSYSSWSLRGWLLFEKTGLPLQLQFAEIYGADFLKQLAEFAPARTVPALRLPDGTAVTESLAIAEELASRHPEAGLWPEDPSARAMARSMAAEMHAGFTALRGDCPQNLRVSYAGFRPAAGVLADLARLERLWALARDRFGSAGPWLFGAWSAADAFFAPVAGRIASYGLPVGPEAQAYVDLQLADPAFRRWRALGAVEGPDIPRYHLPLAARPWPGPKPLPARAVAGTEAENTACPYSGRPVTHVLEFRGRRWGFCNPTCRDMTLQDPEAWPSFMAMAGG
ncbi:glutathione S-transferase [Frigidibacter sp. ROC022]|uniref:glutathione S-transferase n=1 Tax=Frigidibacter sp. ROC022 TaxID=2971796 RepID=UPI00215A91F7|nr:glutathione S-transferase [Frigidibacter sp. ROC022]MCR8724017.1 glutathione S-transferase [Frigidibacter sp. ROC022]